MIVIKNGFILENNELVKKDIYIDNGLIVEKPDYLVEEEYDATDCLVSPGFVDIHVHLREPGYSYKETIRTGTLSAAKGGFTTIFAMPNLKPTPDSLINLKVEEELIKKDALVNVYPYASITKKEEGKELSDIDELSPKVLAFSDDGVGINDYDLLTKAALKIKANDKVLVSHAENNIYKTKPEGEYLAVKEEVKVALATKVKYHFCHLSTKESFSFVKEAKLKGASVTCEVTPHHLFLNETMINNNPNFKMNPPLRSKEDQEETIKALLEGTATIIASDHAPHSKEEKNCEYNKALNGIIGLETTVPLVYTYLVRTNKATLSDMTNWLIHNPRKLMNLKPTSLNVGEVADICVMDLKNHHKYSLDEILSKGYNTPFIGYDLYGYMRYTFVKGKLVYRCQK